MDIFTLALAKKLSRSAGTSRTISSATEPGQVGELCYDTNYLYICVAADTWKRIALDN